MIITTVTCIVYDKICFQIISYFYNFYRNVIFKSKFVLPIVINFILSIRTSTMAKKTVKGFKTKSKKKGGNKKKKGAKKDVIKTLDTVQPVSTPVGSVHFDEFLKICEDPKPLVLVEPVKEGKSKKKKKKNAKSKAKKKKKKKTSGKKGGKKNKKSKKKGKKKSDEKPPSDEPVSTYPPLFPLIKTLFVSAEDDVFGENTLFSVSK